MHVLPTKIAPQLRGISRKGVKVLACYPPLVGSVHVIVVSFVEPAIAVVATWPAHVSSIPGCARGRSRGLALSRLCCRGAGGLL